MRLVHDLVRLSVAGAIIGGAFASCGAPTSTEATVGGISALGGGPGGSNAGGGTPGGGGTTGSIPVPPGGGQFGSASGGIPGTVVTPGALGGAGSPAGADGTCQITTVDFLGDTPDMLIVMDRSASLNLDPLNNRWDPARNAIKQVTKDWEQLIGFGLEFFPADDAQFFGPDQIFNLILGGGNLDLGPACAGTIKLDVPIMTRNANAIAQTLDRAQTTGFTPTAAALQQALTILGDRTQQLDTRVKPGFVLLVTDGDPMCDLTYAADPTGAGDTGQQQAALQAVMALQAAGIPTYVFGYQIDPTKQAYMNMLAQAGDTKMYFAVENQQSIVAAFQQITKDVVRCEFELGMPPQDPSFVRIEIDSKTIPYNTPDGWTLTNGTHVTLQGASCSGLKDGKVHNLNAQIECTVVVPL